MKKKYAILTFFCLVAVALSSCSSSDDELLIESALSDIEAASGTKQVILSWNNTEAISYVDILVEGLTSTYKETTRHQVNEEAKSQVSISVPEGNEVYRFTLVAYSKAGKAYAPQIIKGKPYTNDTQGEIDMLLQNLVVESVANGVKLSWNNSNNISCLLIIEYSEAGVNKKIEYDARTPIPVKTIQLTNKVDATIYIKGIDEREGVQSSEVLKLSFEPNKPYKLSKAEWTVYAVSSQSATSGNGSAACAIDNDPATRWLGTNKGGAEWIIIDMGKPAVIERLALARYFNSTDNSAWDVTFSLGDTPSLSSWEYEYSYANTLTGVFKIEFNRTIEGDQLYTLPNPVVARYFKYRTDRISASWWTHYGEISAYGFYQE